MEIEGCLFFQQKMKGKAMVDIYRELTEMRNSGQAGVLITVIDKKGHGPSIIGKKMLVFFNGLTKGTVGGGDLEYLAIKKAKELIIEKKTPD